MSDLERFARAFTEWDRRYREDPEAFALEAERLLRETPETYGEACAPYFLSILVEQRPPVPPNPGIDERGRPAKGTL